MLINIGFGNVVNMDKVISIVRADAAPVKKDGSGCQGWRNGSRCHLWP